MSPAAEDSGSISGGQQAMGKLKVTILRYLSREDFRVLTAVSVWIQFLGYESKSSRECCKLMTTEAHGNGRTMPRCIRALYCHTSRASLANYLYCILQHYIEILHCMYVLSG